MQTPMLTIDLPHLPPPPVPGDTQLAQQRRDARKSEKIREISAEIAARETFSDRWGASLR